jgi:cyclomaltodextrinase
MPKLNLLNAETAEYFMNVAEHWIREADIDGWRFDVAFGVPYDFWRKLRAKLKKVKPDVYLLGEFGNGNPDPSAWVGAETFDAVMNYPLRSIILDLVVFEKIGIEEYHQKLMELMGKLPRKASYGMYNLLGSHDTPRLLTLCKGDLKKAKLAVLLQMTLPGAPAIYHGDEIGLQGENDPDCRRTMPWDTGKWNLELFNHHKQLIQIRKDHPALAMGDLRVVVKDEERGIYAFQRTFKNDQVTIYANNRMEKTVISTRSNSSLTEAFSRETYEPYKGIINLHLEPKSGIVLVKSGDSAAGRHA